MKKTEKSYVDDITCADDVTDIQDVHEDNTHKIDVNEFAKVNQRDMEAQVAEFERLESEYRSKDTWWDRVLFAQLPLRARSSRQLVIILGSFAAFSGVLSGLDQSIISGAMDGIKASLHTTSDQMSLISALMPLGAMAGSIMMTPLNHYLGRRNSIIVSCLWYTLGGMMCAGARNIPMLYAARFFVGIGVGIEGGCVGIYISESVPPRIRGNLVSIYQMMIAFGEVIGYSDSAVFYDIKDGNWRYMLGSSVLFSTILLIGMCFLPESPRWLVSKGRTGRAWGVWKRLRDVSQDESKLEFLEMVAAARQEQERAANEKVWERYLELFTVKRNRRAFVYSWMMILLGQMTGVNSIMYDMSLLMKQIGFDAKKSVSMSIVGGGSLFVGTIPAVLYSDRFGRRVWAQNIVMFIVGLILVGVAYLFSDPAKYADPVREAAYLEKNRPKAMGLFFPGLILYMGFFGCYSTLTWSQPAESFDMRTRSQGMAICSAFLYLWSFIVTFNFDRMSKAMTYTGLMIGFYGGIAVVGFFYQIFFMPELNGKTLEEIDDVFNMRTHDLVALNMRNMVRRWGWIIGKRPKKQNNSVATDAEEGSSSLEKSPVSSVFEHPVNKDVSAH